jgi:hypothetical protein
MELYSLTTEDFTIELNRVKEIIINDLVRENLLSKSDADNYLKTRVVLLYSPSWWGKAWAKLNNMPDDRQRISIGRIDV